MARERFVFARPTCTQPPSNRSPQHSLQGAASRSPILTTESSNDEYLAAAKDLIDHLESDSWTDGPQIDPMDIAALMVSKTANTAGVIWADAANFRNSSLWPFLPSQAGNAAGKVKRSLERKANAPDHLPITIVGVPRTASRAEVTTLLEENGIAFIENSMILHGLTSRYEYHRGHGVVTADVTVEAVNNERLWTHLLGIRHIVWTPHQSPAEYHIYIIPQGTPDLWIRLHIVTTPVTSTNGESSSTPRLIALRIMHDLGYSEGEAALILTNAFNDVSEKLRVLAVAFDHTPYAAPAGSRPPIPWYHPEGGISLLFTSRAAADEALNVFSNPTYAATRATRQLIRGQADPLLKTIRIDLGVTAGPRTHASRELQKRKWSFPPLEAEETDRREVFSIAGQLAPRSRLTGSATASTTPTPSGVVTEEERPRSVFIGNLPVRNVQTLFQHATGASLATPRADLITEVWLQALTTRLGLNVERIVLPLNAAGTWDIARGAWIVFANEAGDGVANARDMVRRINLPTDDPESLQHLVLAAITRSGGETVYIRPGVAITANMDDGSTAQPSEWQVVKRLPARRSMGRGNPNPPQSAFRSTSSNPTYAMVVSPTKTMNKARSAANACPPPAPKSAPVAAAPVTARRSLNTQMEQQVASIAISPQQSQLSEVRGQSARIEKLENGMEEMKAMLQKLLLSQQSNSPVRKRGKSGRSTLESGKDDDDETMEEEDEDGGNASR